MLFFYQILDISALTVTLKMTFKQGLQKDAAKYRSINKKYIGLDQYLHNISDQNSL